MAYAGSLNTKRRLGTASAVALVQIAVGYALVSGLAASFLPRAELPPILTDFIPQPKPKPDTPKPQVDQARPSTTPPVHDTRQVVPNDTPTFSPVADPVFDGISAGDGTAGDIGEVRIPVADPPSRPVLVRGAKPRGNPGLWVTANDYPAADLRQEHTGVTRFRLDIGADGKVTDCTVTGSSGHPGLDQAACAKLIGRARFDPAIDSTGARLAGSYSSSVRWQIPE